MTYKALPAIWLIILIVGLPQFSETVYTPSLPEIAEALRASESIVEYTLTIYLFGFAIGTLFWGGVSDRLGRKPCVIKGLVVFVAGCFMCYTADTIEALMIGRLVQAFGGSVGSILGQAICRDAFQGAALGRVYSSVGSALALFPALGPVIGGWIAQSFGWATIFMFLIVFTLVLLCVIIKSLPETHKVDNRKSVSWISVALRMMKDCNVIGFGLIVAGCNGILSSYFAEGSFCLIKVLRLTPSEYGISFIAIALSTMTGGVVSKKLLSYRQPKNIIYYGLNIVAIASLAFSIIVCAHNVWQFTEFQMVVGIIMSQMFIAFGICMATSNALALSLGEYKAAIGTASSLFGFFYYCVISLFTLGIGLLHNDSLLVMPLYFLAVSIFMLLVRRVLL